MDTPKQLRGEGALEFDLVRSVPIRLSLFAFQLIPVCILACHHIQGGIDTESRLHLSVLRSTRISSSVIHVFITVT